MCPVPVSSSSSPPPTPPPSSSTVPYSRGSLRAQARPCPLSTYSPSVSWCPLHHHVTGPPPTTSSSCWLPCYLLVQMCLRALAQGCWPGTPLVRGSCSVFWPTDMAPLGLLLFSDLLLMAQISVCSLEQLCSLFGMCVCVVLSFFKICNS